jgi:ESF2/ABP1 family protein
LNNQLIGGKKRNYYHDDVWNIKYLKGFQWIHLTEKANYERSIREQKIRLELQRAKQETNGYMEQVNKAKKWKAIEERKEKKSGEKQGNKRKAEENNEEEKIVKRIHQRSLIERKSIADLPVNIVKNRDQ